MDLWIETGKNSVDVNNKKNILPLINIDSLKKNLDYLWTNSLIPDYYREAFIKSIEWLNLKQYDFICKKELKLLKENRALSKR